MHASLSGTEEFVYRQLPLRAVSNGLRLRLTKSVNDIPGFLFKAKPDRKVLKRRRRGCTV